MGLEVVVNEIIEQGRAEAAKIEKEGLTEAKEILAEAKAKAERILQDRQAAAARDAERLKVQEVARAEFEAKKKVLTAQRDLLAQLKAEALEALSGLPEQTRRTYLEKLVAAAKKEVPSGTIHCLPQDQDIVRSISDYEVIGDLQGTGGIVVEAEGGTISLDMRFESLLEDVWPQILRQETKTLFGSA